MEVVKIVATVEKSKIGAVENGLKEIATPRMSLMEIRGYGEYRNMFDDEMLESRYMIEVIIEQAKSDVVIQAIMDAASTGVEGDGIITIEPVQDVYLIRTRQRLYEK